MPKKKTAKNPGAQSLLVELLTEELPPKALHKLANKFREYMYDYLSEYKLLTPTTEKIKEKMFATPRRLAVLFPGVLDRQPDREEGKPGPYAAVALNPNGTPNEKLLGFARRWNATIEDLERNSDEKGEYFFYRLKVKGEQLAKVLPEIVEKAIKQLPVPKMMRWGDSDTEFVRPVHGLVMMHGSRVVPGEVLGLTSGNRTRGHRFLGKSEITLSNADGYEAKLRDEGLVIADFAARRAEIERQLLAEAKRLDASLGDYQGLLDEVTALVEWPAVYSGTFDKRFLSLPQECLILSMKQHQRYFPLANKTGKLLPSFLMVSNLQTANSINIIHGNERVLHARLSDAKFFYDQDRKTRLEARVPRLAPVVYHNKLGSQLERVERIQLLAGKIARDLSADAVLAERAAWLSKADLLTGMVGEFPELQGVMGRYYAIHDGEPRVVADAIEQHYRPRFAADRLPDGPTACAVALADKLNTLAGLFSIGGQPTGDKDPFGLRRAALGVVRIIVENQLPLLLWDLVNAAFEPFKGKAQTDLRMFFIERMRSYFQERGYTANEVEAVLSLHPAETNLVPKQLEAVRAFSALPEAVSLAAANKRVVNILKQAEAKGESFINAEANKLQEPAERALFDALKITSQQAASLFKQGDFTGYLKTFAVLKSPVDAFFDSVMVMVDNPALRHNRLALLADLRHAMNRVADISKLAA